MNTQHILTTNNIGNVFSDDAMEQAFLSWSARQGACEGQDVQVVSAKRTRIGDVSYQLLSDGKVRGKCPVIGLFIAAHIVL